MTRTLASESTIRDRHYKLADVTVTTTGGSVAVIGAIGPLVPDDQIPDLPLAVFALTTASITLHRRGSHRAMGA